MALNDAHYEYAAAHHGVFRRTDLLDLGLSRRQLQVLVANGTLTSPHRGTFVLAGTPGTDEQRLGVACASQPAGAGSGRTAGRFHGLRRLGPAGALEFTVPGTTKLTLPGIVVHRCHYLPADHVTERDDGIRITTPLRTAFDLCAELTDWAIESIVEQILDELGVTMDEVIALGREVRQRGRTGSARYGRVVESRPIDQAPAGSGLEVDLLQALRPFGLEEPVRQAELIVPGERGPIHPDLYWPSLRLAVEIDHFTWHGHRTDVQYDKQRDRNLAAIGVQVVRVTDDDIRGRLQATAAQVAAIARQRAELSARRPRNGAAGSSVRGDVSCRRDRPGACRAS